VLPEGGVVVAVTTKVLGGHDPVKPIFPRCPAPGPRLQLQQLKLPT
jgi:hypothetical protein